jgi:hypothetical protein
MSAAGCLHPHCTAPVDYGPLCWEHAPVWRDLAACAGTHLGMWFSKAADSIEACRTICRSCPVLDLCLADALAEEAGLTRANRHGTRAGLTPTERVRASVPAAAARPAVH